MRIEHVMPAFGRIPRDPTHDARSGIVHAALAFADESARRQHQVGLIGWSPGDPRRHVTPAGVSIRTHPGYRFGRFGRWDVRWLAPVFLQSLRSSSPGVLHVHMDPNQLRLRGAARILHLHGFVDASVGDSYLQLLGKADAVVCCSAHIRSRFLRATGWIPERTHVVHNGTDPDRIQPASDRVRAGARAQLGIPEHATVFLYIGAIAPDKGVIHAVRAFSAAQSRLPDAVLLLAGGASLWSGMSEAYRLLSAYERHVAEEAQTNEHVRMLGPLPHGDLLQLLHAASVTVVPSIWQEPFGMVALDSAAAGLPVIASQTGGLPEVVEPRTTGMLVPPGDEDALAAAMLQLARDADLRRRLGGAARERAVQLSWSRASDNLHAVYAKALARHASGRPSLEMRRQ